MKSTLIEALADRLAEAERTRVPVDPLTACHPGLTATEAYEIQRTNIERRLAAGAAVRGHKIGLTARSMQELFGIDEPDYGHLVNDMFVPEGAVVPVDQLISPRVEIEVAVILGRQLRGPGVTVADVVRAVEYLLPSIEIIDSRVRDWQIKLADTIADNGSSARVVLGGRPVRLTAVDLRRTATRLQVDGQPISNGSTGAVLGNPLTAVAWLANAVGEAGVALKEGHVILPGTPLPAVPVQRGTHVTGIFDGIGDVEISFG